MNNTALRAGAQSTNNTHIQDSIYLKNYARVFGKAIYHAETLREIQLYYSMLNFVTDRKWIYFGQDTR